MFRGGWKLGCYVLLCGFGFVDLLLFVALFADDLCFGRRLIATGYEACVSFARIGTCWYFRIFV